MGQPKLFLPWPTKINPQGTVLDSVLGAWTRSTVHQVVVVARDDDSQLHEACQRWPVHLVRASEPPADMKASVQLGVRFLEANQECGDQDRCFVAPADLPMLSESIINDLAGARADSSTVIVPRFGGQSGHPALLPWPMMSQVSDLAENEGVNRIVDAANKLEIHFPANQRVNDIDTPEEYRAALDLARQSGLCE